MLDNTRKSIKELDVLVVQDSDSEPDPQDTPPLKKKQKTGPGPKSAQLRGKSPMFDDDRGDESNTMDVDDQSTHPVKVFHQKSPSAKNTHLKGRKRFVADLADLKEECKNGLVHDGLRMKTFRPGDDEGSIELTIVKADALENVVSANLFVSDTSDYPTNHTIFGAATDGKVTARMESVFENLASEVPKPLYDLSLNLLSSVATALKTSARKQPESRQVSEDEDEEDYEAYDYDDDISTIIAKSATLHQFPRLQRDFLDIVATNYRPGIIQFGRDDFCVSVSLPVITLAKSIPVRALHAWDRRLLSRPQSLTLLIYGFRGVYPALTPDGSLSAEANRMAISLSFKVGLTKRYKPGKEQAHEASHNFGLIAEDAADKQRELDERQQQLLVAFSEEDPDVAAGFVMEEKPEVEDEGRFDRFSLSSSLESLMNTSLLKIIQYRRKFRLGWAGAEMVHKLVEQSQTAPSEVYRRNLGAIQAADREETKLGRTYALPHDPLPETAEINLPLTAFCYLVRRLTLVSRYCIVCHNKTDFDFETLKPYVCGSKLCSYQYYTYNQGPSLEYEIVHNSETVDLLVSLAYSAAAEGALDDPMPVGMGLRVPVPSSHGIRAPVSRANVANLSASVPNVAESESSSGQVVQGPDSLCDLDTLTKAQMREAIVNLINSLPSIEDMKKHLVRKVSTGKSRPKLRHLDANIIPAAWSILRWCIASCTAHIEPLNDQNSVRELGSDWRQFRFSIGAPDAEAKFKAAVSQGQTRDKNALQYPTLYAFHGSPLRNWHSIIRHGLWYKEVTHGRAYGNGVYLAKEGQVSMGSYAVVGKTCWKNSRSRPTNCVALAEVVNVPKEFVSHNPYYVVKDTEWIMCRYLLVRCAEVGLDDPPVVDPSSGTSITPPFVKLDPHRPLTLNSKAIEIPEPAFELETLLAACIRDQTVEAYDAEDMAIFEYTAPPASPPTQDTGRAQSVPAISSQPVEDWTPDPAYVKRAIENLMPRPMESSNTATVAVQRELRMMLKEQNAARKKPGGLKELGWYLPSVSDDGDDEGGGVGDNLFQWIVELHSFDPALPIAKDMKDKGVNSLIFEIRFPPTFPHSPPFFRIITPRFLPFIRGGGGHVTGGGSICMDLLTADGWLPSYSIAAVMTQIRVAISNLDPKPARLDANWQRPYHISEALEGYKRAAATHGWKVPPGLYALAR